MTRPVVWSVDAYRDTLAILGHIADDDPDTAERIVDIIEAAGDRFGERSIGRPGRVAGTFEKSLAPLPWILCYTIQTDAGHESVLILRVIHTARNWPSGTWPKPD